MYICREYLGYHMDVIINIKNLFLAIIAFLWGVYSPIKDFMLAMLLLFFFNFIAGLTADIVEKPGIAWDNKKAWQCIVQMFVFFGTIAFFVLIGHYLHQMPITVQCISSICYAAVLFYLRNINRNIIIIIPKKSPMQNLFKFTYYVLSVQFLEQIPSLKKYINEHKTEIDNENN